MEFVGRRTMYKGSYGHMGMSDQELVVDHIISMKELEAPPPPPSKEDQIKYWKKCEAERTCIPNWDYINKEGSGAGPSPGTKKAADQLRRQADALIEHARRQVDAIDAADKCDKR